ncbi:hypothetical protein DWB77_00273 [Streptomyces hundungensis]|uniref:Secreted protein n=1 Tax=Streptomyces hundungensis TaxID=1077946 RepID=A0A387H3B9_9ACTN|nr:hypothetical protein [Streptomyces hundungensis]AYG78166.1 hypothetical protein DWB77_00273 [Streptomyces hundungensis]
MTSLRTACAGAALTVLAVMATPVMANATETAPASTTATAANPPDGRFHTYFRTWYQNECGAWPSDAAAWGACKNTSESVWNLGYPGLNDDVWVYCNSNYGGAGRGIYNGAGLPDLHDWRFGSGGSCSGEQMWHNIASHKFVNLP